jgi:hypothetical protein
MGPEESEMGARIRVPAAILAARRGVHVEDSVDSVGGARADNAVELDEAGGFEDERVYRILEVPIVERDADAVQAKGFEEGGVGISEEILKKL